MCLKVTWGLSILSYSITVSLLQLLLWERERERERENLQSFGFLWMCVWVAYFTSSEDNTQAARRRGAHQGVGDVWPLHHPYDWLPPSTFFSVFLADFLSDGEFGLHARIFTIAEWTTFSIYTDICNEITVWVNPSKFNQQILIHSVFD